MAIDTSGIRHFIILLTADVPAASEGVKSLRTIARVGRLGTHAVSYAATARCDPGARNQITGSAIRTGWCRRRAVDAVPLGKRFDSIRFPPSLRTWSIGWASECLSVEAGSIPAVRASSPG